MFNDFRWGGISVRGIIRTLLPDVWMVFAVMIITYLAIGLAAPLLYTPEYKAEAIVAVYPGGVHSPADSSGDRIDAAGAVSVFLRGRPFQVGLKELLDDSEERTITASEIKATNLVTITVTSTSAGDAYNTVRTLIEYYGEMADDLTGDRELEILVQPEIPLEPENTPELLNYRSILTLFMGFSMGALLAFLYLIRKTYKTAGSVQRRYKDKRFFLLSDFPARKKGFAGNKGPSGKKEKKKVLRRNTVRRTAEELRQMLQALGGKSILIASAAQGEGTADFACELADELESLGSSVLLVEADFENSGITERLGREGDIPEQGILDALGGECSVKDIIRKHPEKNILTACAGLLEGREDSRFHYTPEDVKRVMKEAKGLADIILIDSGVWGGAGDSGMWNSESDFSLAVCAPDKAGFFAVDQLVGDLSGGRSEFAGIILNGF